MDGATVADPSATGSPGGALAGVPRGVVILLGAAAAVVVVVGMYAGSWLLGPLLLALVIVIAVSPLQTWLRRVGWPAWAATLSLVVVIYGTLLVLTAFLVASVSQLSALLAQNEAKAQQLVASLTAALAKLGVDPTQARNTAGSADLSKLAASLGSLLSGLGSLLSSLVFILALLLFLTAESSGTARRMAMIADERPHMIAALDGFVRGTRNYLVVTAVFGGIVAVLDGIALWIMGIPLVLLWAVLAFITNFIPNIGFIIGLVPPALLALLTGGWQLALAVVVVYCVLNMVIQSLIQPRFIGDSVGLSATVTFLALLFWAWVLGPLGALLAIPVTLLVKAVLVDSDPRARWVEALLGADPPKPKTEKPKRARHIGNGHRPTAEDSVTPPRT
ncbi:AI-2E family transporter [Actinomycetospora lutea]|uniref:AI-2E family transporter n=1 Tax=Actinomycetospora lutea TaxID=663604 RepID=UPI0023654E6E|nr:AI-2E family transporter [Actinomycetospora lutea]MDD7942488.1 AI-2E family transporter [Actinomycetospora lutea]